MGQRPAVELVTLALPRPALGTIDHGKSIIDDRDREELQCLAYDDCESTGLTNQSFGTPGQDGGQGTDLHSIKGRVRNLGAGGEHDRHNAGFAIAAYSAFYDDGGC